MNELEKSIDVIRGGVKVQNEAKAAREMRLLAQQAAERNRAHDAIPVCHAAHATCDESLDGSTDESMDKDILVDATPIPVSTACCEGGAMKRPDPANPETRVYKQACEDSHPTYRQTTHFERLDSLPMRAGLICEQAAKIVGGDRMAYGKPEMNFDRTAILWEALDCAIATVPENHVPPTVVVALRMVLLKMARIIETPTHTDSYRDGAGYFDCGARCAGCDPAK